MKVIKKYFYFSLLILLFNCNEVEDEYNYHIYGEWEIIGEKYHIKWNEYKNKYDTVSIENLYVTLYDIIFIGYADKFLTKDFPNANYHISSYDGEKGSGQIYNFFSNNVIENQKKLHIGKEDFIDDNFNISNLFFPKNQSFDQYIDIEVLDRRNGKNDSIRLRFTIIKDSIFIYNFSGIRLR